MALRRARFGESEVVLATPRGLPKPARLEGTVVVLDIAFASESGGSSFERTTLPFIQGLGDRLLGWVDHHDSVHHARFAADSRFVLCTKAEHGACPELVTPALVARVGVPNTIVCHDDFDGLVSAAKWLRSGVPPYEGCDDDARAVDTCTGAPGPIGRRIERALRALPRDPDLFAAVLAVLLGQGDPTAAWRSLDAAATGLDAREARARALAQRFRLLSERVAFVDVADEPATFDPTTLLLEGQRRAPIAVVARGGTVTFAAGFNSGVDFVAQFGLSGGMPTRVSIGRERLTDALVALGVPAAVAAGCR